MDSPGGLEAGTFPDRWIHGSERNKKRDPPLQVHKYNDNTYIMRVSKDVSYEAPFLYLLFGKVKAMLIDTGTSADRSIIPLRETVDHLISEWISSHNVEKLQLIITHTHGHNDHTSGDSQFADRAETTVIGKSVEDVKQFFNISKFPEDSAFFELGDRKMEIIPTPGHDPREISFYDPSTGFLITGDLVYPGRLYAFDFPSFLQSLQKLVAFTSAHKISHVMGTHIEMKSIPKRDYPILAKYQPREHILPMSVDLLVSIRDSASMVKDKPGAHYFADFAIYNGMCRGAVLKSLIRSFGYNLIARLRR